jgi:hypothetical protein
MVAAAERNSEFIAGLARHRPVLGKPKMVGLRRASATDEARLLRHKLDMVAIADAARFRKLQQTFIYPL